MPDAIITLGQFAKIMAGAGEGRIRAWHAALVPELRAADIITDVRQAAIFASMANETGGLKLLDEADLSYIGTPYERIREVFGHSAPPRELNEQWRALGRPAYDVQFLNWVYDDANRGPGYGLGNTHPGDGHKYRGMGPGATTGLGNFRWLAKLVGMPEVVDNPDLVKTPEVGAKIVCVQWVANGCNQMVDDGSQAGFLRTMWKLNAGLKDFSHHLAYWDVAKRALADDTIIDMPAPLPLEKRRNNVVDLQEALTRRGFSTGGIDGIAGPNTTAAILAFQRATPGLTVDGIVGPKTLTALAIAA